MTTNVAETWVDSRDGTSYLIAKLPDGSAWMIQNLRLGQKGGSYSLNSTNSDTSSFVLSSSDKLALPSFTNASSNGVDGATDYVQYYCTDASDPSTDFGCYYNYYTATAGTGNSTTGRGVTVSDSICPAGWKLPSLTQWQTLYGYYNSPSLMLADEGDRVKNKNGAMPGIVLAGGIYTQYAGTMNGNLWTNTTLGYSDARGILFVVNASGTNVYFGNNDPFYFGMPIRCVWNNS